MTTPMTLAPTSTLDIVEMRQELERLARHVDAWRGRYLNRKLNVAEDPYGFASDVYHFVLSLADRLKSNASAWSLRDCGPDDGWRLYRGETCMAEVDLPVGYARELRGALEGAGCGPEKPGEALPRVATEAAALLRRLAYRLDPARAQEGLEKPLEHWLWSEKETASKEAQRLADRLAESFPAVPAAPDEGECARALRELVAQLDYVHDHPAYMNVWAMAQAHSGSQYQGPQYTEQLEAARSALSDRADSVKWAGKSERAEIVSELTKLMLGWLAEDPRLADYDPVRAPLAAEPNPVPGDHPAPDTASFRRSPR